MLSASADIWFIDYIFRPFAKIYEKMPLVMLLIVMILYSIIGYFVLRSAYVAEEH
jgi:hypothetical protein